MKVVCITEALRPYIPIGIGDEVTIKEIFPIGLVYYSSTFKCRVITKEKTCQLVEFPQWLCPLWAFVPIDEVPEEVEEIEEEIFA